MKVNIEDILKMQEFRNSINKPSLDEIEFYLNGKKLDINPQTISEFQDIGLNNVDFITSGYYKRQ
jgi:hypothetical protein